ncbi:MAG TPA: hypothetical protein VKR60_12020 [Candidatus Sulfotelmatobacter sp.]|nr:hypothetical protein [Candidatus Sulfotelmatobacter sp.]
MRFRVMLSAGLVWLGAICSAPAQQSSSLADAARQARAQKADQPKAEPSKAQEVVNQLVEDQDDTGNAPAGFKTYNAGDYRLFVPAPYTVEGRDNSGIVLVNSAQGRARSLVLVGNPVVLPPGSGDDAFGDAASQIAHIYAPSATCTPATVAGHKAYQCGLAGATLLGRKVGGNAVFVRGSRNMIPVFCVAPTDSRARDMYNNPHSNSRQKAYAKQVMEREDQDVRNTWQACDSVLQSVRLKEDGGTTATASVKTDNAASATAPAAPAQAAAGSASNAPAASSPATSSSQVATASAGGSASLAEIARRIHESPAPGAVAQAQPQRPPDNAPESDAAPEGFKTQSFRYCKAHSQQCWDALIFVPADAKLLSSGCKQYVFETKVNGETFLLLAGQSGSAGCEERAPNDPDPVRWHQLVDPESIRAPGTAATISNLQMTLAGKSAVITKLKFKKGLADWMAKRADVESNGLQIVVGCMAPRDSFADGEAMCTTLIESLRLP